ncbi:MAG: cobalamin-dependent protein [Spirochaetes bacterium]|nr:cobalamin-dependent protein [Spirochaetota bacterium]
MKILLISANTVRVPYYIYPLGLDYVAGALAGKHTVRIADVNLSKKIDPLLDMIREFNPDAIGISLRNIDNTDVNDTRGFIQTYRTQIAEIRTVSRSPIILGGSGFTIFPKQLMAELKADYGIIGEGERLPLLLEAIEAGTDASAIPGVITGTGAEKVPPPLDEPFRRSFIGGDIARFYIDRGGILNLQTKRGCSYNCIYCTYPHIEGSDLRPVPAAEVAQTALELQRMGGKYFFITDSAFNCDYHHSAEVARAFKEKGVSIPWGAFLAPTMPPEGYYRLLRDSAMTHAEFGTESLSNTMLASYRKPFNVKDVLAAHRAALDAGLFVAHYLLLGGPGETRETIGETLDNAEGLDKTVLFFFCGIRIYPHTKLHEIAVREGQIRESDDLLEPVFYQSPGIASDEIMRLVRERAAGRENWFVGTTSASTTRLVSRLHKQGHVGPLWEHMIR